MGIFSEYNRYIKLNICFFFVRKWNLFFEKVELNDDNQESLTTIIIVITTTRTRETSRVVLRKSWFGSFWKICGKITTTEFFFQDCSTRFNFENILNYQGCFFVFWNFQNIFRPTFLWNAVAYTAPAIKSMFNSIDLNNTVKTILYYCEEFYWHSLS